MRSSPPTVLVTAFEPFGGDAFNASELAVRPLAGRIVVGHTVVVEILPCVFGAAIEAMREALARVQPALVVACGEAAGRTGISIERVAINVDDARIPDNRGARPIDRPVVPGAPAAYFSTLPIKAIVRALHAGRVPADVSQTAGTFVCNHLFFGLMHALAVEGAPRAGFVHVPRAPAMSTEAVTAALEVVVATALAVSTDEPISGGATS